MAAGEMTGGLHGADSPGVNSISGPITLAASLAQATQDVMRGRVDWSDLLVPAATEPPFEGQDGGWPSPDW